MNNFIFGLSEIGGQASAIVKTENGTQEPAEQTEPSSDGENDIDIINLQNLFLSFNRFIPYLTLFKLPVYFN